MSSSTGSQPCARAARSAARTQRDRVPHIVGQHAARVEVSRNDFSEPTLFTASPLRFVVQKTLRVVRFWPIYPATTAKCCSCREKTDERSREDFFAGAAAETSLSELWDRHQLLPEPCLPGLAPDAEARWREWRQTVAQNSGGKLPMTLYFCLNYAI